MDANQIQALVTATIQATLAGAATPSATFTHSPGQALENQIKCSSLAGAKLCAKNTASLPAKFSLEKPNIHVLLMELNTRARSANSSEALKINVNQGTTLADDEKSMLVAHGQVTIEQCKQYLLTHIFTETQCTQNNFQICMCLARSVDSDTTKKMANESSNYMTQHPANPNHLKPCGICYLKLLLSKAKLNTRALASIICNRLTKLDIYIINTHITERCEPYEPL